MHQVSCYKAFTGFGQFGQGAFKNADMEDSFVKGIKLVSDDLQKTLASEGLVEIKSDGEKFDANFHHAVFMEENDQVESGYIMKHSKRDI